ncbi:MAG: hypothetical protein H7A24_04090 [Leptospiraceae bacterium]|nr:hypothetical protein [Leptospiraceae bacterium]MCP5511034.1 hypothetical protein [Leptospiraceae bacterium]
MKVSFSKYEKEWKQVEEAENKGLPKSALETVSSIYQKAKKEKNPAQQVKSIIFQIKLEAEYNDEEIVSAVNRLKKEIETSESPVKQLLHSMLGELYWNYYSQNRYKFLNRTKVEGEDPTDIRTWDLKTIVDNTSREYLESLKDTESSKVFPIEAYEALLHRGYKGEVLRPTLYDFLAHRAIDFFANSESGLVRPADQFYISKSSIQSANGGELPLDYFSDADEFISAKIITEDKESFQYRAVKLFQELLEFRKSILEKTSDSKEKETIRMSFFDVDLKRLNFVNSHSIEKNKKETYLKVLDLLLNKYSDTPLFTSLTAMKADAILAESRSYRGEEDGELKWMIKKADQLCEDAINKFPKSDGAQNCRAIRSEIRKKYFSFQLNKITPPDEKFPLLLHHRNLEEVYVKIFHYNPEDANTVRDLYNGFSKKGLYREYESLFVEFYSNLSPVRDFKVNLKNDGDFYEHSSEIILPELETGRYIVFLSPDEELKSKNTSVIYDLFNVSNLAYLSRNTDDSKEFYITDRNTGDPIQNVRINQWDVHYNSNKGVYDTDIVDSFKTDQNGFFKLPLFLDNKSRSYYLELIYGTESILIANEGIGLYESHLGYFSQGRKYSYNNENHEISRVFFFTDRGIYRPGQQLFFKGILLTKGKEDSKILPNTNVNVILQNPNGQKAGQLSLTSNEYGSVNGAFTLPTGGITGSFTLYAEGFNGNQSISVEEYKRPKFETTILPIQGSYKLKDKLKVTGNAKAYSGANIDGAKVKYRVKRVVIFPRWWYYYFDSSSYSSEMEITSGETITDEKGEFQVLFEALPDLSISESSNPKFHFRVEADVTDINGETRSASRVIVAGYSSLVVNLNSPDKFFSADDNKIKISTENLSGEFEPVDVNISLTSLKSPDKAYRKRIWQKPDRPLYSKEEWEKSLPYDEYANETNFYTWDEDTKVLEMKLNTKDQKSFTLENYDSLKPGVYKLEASALDPDKKEVKDIQYITIFGSKSPELPYPTMDLFEVRKAYAEVGETAHFIINNQFRGKALYELEHKGKVVYSEWLDPSKTPSSLFSLQIPIIEKFRGNFGIHITYVHKNRFFQHSQNISVPYSNKKLDIKFMSFRNKLEPGSQEEWKLIIKGAEKDKIAAEMLATMYDASLDAFRSNPFHFDIHNFTYPRQAWSSLNAFRTTDSHRYENNWNQMDYRVNYSYDTLDWFNFDFGYHGHRRYRKKSKSATRDMEGGEPPLLEKNMDEAPSPAPAMAMSDSASDEAEEAVAKADKPSSPKPAERKEEESSEEGKVEIRSNFSETAFFYPELTTDSEGTVIVSFKLPDSLTRWKMQGFAHTKNLSYGFITNELIAQKDLMIVPNPPRFFREGDSMTFSVKVTNLSEENLSGKIKLELFDSVSMKPVTELFMKENSEKDFASNSGLSSSVSWDLKIPEKITAVTYRLVATAGKFSDGEELAIPVLTNRMLVTETLPLPIRTTGSKEFKFEKLINSGNSDTLRHNNFSIEFTANPAWYAIQALPYLMEYPYECVEQTFSRYYANSLSTHIVNSNPKIKKVFDAWKSVPDSKKGSLISNLEKNQELKTILLEDTPWIRNAINETERRKRIALLFDINRMSSELGRAFKKIKETQMSEGAWPWFKGMEPNRYMTQHILTGMAHLKHLGVKSPAESELDSIILNGMGYMDRALARDYLELKRLADGKKIDLKDNHLSFLQIQYLYTRSYFGKIPIPKESEEAVKYFTKQAKTYWMDSNKYMQGMIALALHRMEDSKTPVEILKSLKETALVSEELGMYWKTQRGYFWYQMPIETQALMIEVFDEVGKDEKTVDELKTWLLKNKQTTEWETTKATSEAIYALLLRGSNLLENEQLPVITTGSKKIDPGNDPKIKTSAGAGYFKVSFSPSEIKPEMGNITIQKDYKGVSWGAAYWQYFENLDKITPAETPLQLKKQVFKQSDSKTGPVLSPLSDKDPLNVGDLLKVRIELRVDREMEYVHMKDMRASALEPINVFSQYKYQDGLGYFENTRDTATNFFFDYLPKGTYVFEYPLRVTHKGDFSNGITTIQSMYAPEFSSHSEGIRIKVK